jgi:hypothetical protein
MTPERVMHCVAVVERAAEQLEANVVLIAEQNLKIQALSGVATILNQYVQAVEIHNAKCDAECANGVLCGYDEYLKRTKRRCLNCPAGYNINVMPTKGTA